MKPPLAKLRPFLTVESMKARERLAAELYQTDRAKLLMLKRASEGATSARIELAGQWVDLSQTEAAKALQAWAESQTITVEWQARRSADPDGRDCPIFEPVLSW